MIRYIIILLLFSTIIKAQPNCNVFLMNKDTAKYEACEYVTAHKNDYYQFDWRQMDIWNKAIEMSPYLAYPLREYGAPYLKAGNFVEWKKYMDRAVELEPMEYLGIRASLKCKFVADYQGAIDDINELSNLMNGNDIGPTSDGTYHLNIVKGLSYKALGKIDKAISIINNQMSNENHLLGFYDHLHLGVLYLDKKNFRKAIVHLHKQAEQYDLAENRYYLAKAYRGTADKIEFIQQINIARDYILSNKTMTDPYNELFDKVYLEDIIEEIEKEWR